MYTYNKYIRHIFEIHWNHSRCLFGMLHVLRIWNIPCISCRYSFGYYWGQTEVFQCVTCYTRVTQICIQWIDCNLYLVLYIYICICYCVNSLVPYKIYFCASFSLLFTHTYFLFVVSCNLRILFCLLCFRIVHHIISCLASIVDLNVCNFPSFQILWCTLD